MIAYLYKKGSVIMNNRHRTIERIKQRSRSYDFGILVHDIKRIIEGTVKKVKYDWATDLKTTKTELVDRVYDTLPKKPVKITIDLNNKKE
jgi:hypothetical protein